MRQIYLKFMAEKAAQKNQRCNHPPPQGTLIPTEDTAAGDGDRAMVQAIDGPGANRRARERVWFLERP
jgi:hypothetical protein